MWVSGMGTEVQSKMQLPGYHSIRDLNDNASGSGWPSYHEIRTLKNEQYFNLFSTKPASGAFLGYHKEQLRQTILKQESVFRHQLRELHRLHKIQTDLMNEINSREPLRRSVPATISQSRFSSSCASSLDKKKRWHASGLPVVGLYSDRSSKLGTDSIHSHLDMKGKIMQSSHEYSQNGESLKDCELLESKCKRPRKLLIDLELPADEYIDNEEEQLGDFGGSNYIVPCERDVNLSFGSSLKSGCSGEASKSDTCSRRTHGLTDLNAPVQFEKACTSASVGIPPSVTACSKEETRRWNLSANSQTGFEYSAKELLNFHNGRDGKISNLHLENNRNQKEWLPHTSEAGRTLSDKTLFSQSLCPEKLRTSFDSTHVETSLNCEPAAVLLPHQRKAEHQSKRTIFGVEISDRDQNASAVASHTVGLHPPIPQSDFTNAESFFVSSQRRFPSSLSQLLSVKGHQCSNTSSNSNVNPKTLMRSHEFVGDLLNDSKPIPSLTKVSFQNGLCLDSQLSSKELQVCRQSSIGFDRTNGISDSNSAYESFAKHGEMKYFRDIACLKDAKPSGDKSTDVVAPKKYPNEVLSQQNYATIDGQRKKENPQGGLSWLREMLLRNSESCKGREDYDQSNLDSLQNCFEQFSNRTGSGKGLSQGLTQDFPSATHAYGREDGENKVSEGSQDSKVFGFPIFYNPDISKDLSPPVSLAKPNYLLSAIDNANSVKVELFETTKSHDSMSPKLGEQLTAEGQVVDKGSVNHNAGFRDHIDLNLCITEEEEEEEAQLTPSSPKTDVNIAVEIDLDVPVVVEAEKGPTPEGESPESKLREPSDSLKDESTEHHERPIRDAAEALVAISSSQTDNPQDNATCFQSEAYMLSSLNWFAEIVSLYQADIENEVKTISVVKGGYCHEECNPDGIDYFELMTLSLTETKVDEYYYKPQALENGKEEQVLPKRPRRGQARRGRQRKDFQRDVLPGLVSLSRYEVTEDLQIIEGLIGATGGSWQSSLTRRNAAKSGRGRGRRNSGGSVTFPTSTSACLTQIQQPTTKAPELEEKRLMSWGKRTRRLPRRRCPNPMSHPCIQVT